jgi:hypothetical protein
MRLVSQARTKAKLFTGFERAIPMTAEVKQLLDPATGVLEVSCASEALMRAPAALTSHRHTLTSFLANLTA